MKFNKDFALDVAWPAANAAYQAMTLPLVNIGLPAGYTAVRYIDAVPPVHSIVAKSAPFGVIGFGTAGLLVAIRGTETLAEWMDDFEALPQVTALFGKVHAGFWKVYQSIQACLAEVKIGHGDVPTLVIGHSLGGALALLAAADLFTQSTVYTFASPRVGDSAFGKFFGMTVPNCIRIVNEGDVVPHVPLPPLFENVGTAQTVRGGFRLGDISYAHHLEQYRAGLVKL